MKRITNCASVMFLSLWSVPLGTTLVPQVTIVMPPRQVASYLRVCLPSFPAMYEGVARDWL